MDSAHPLTLNNKQIRIPNLLPKLQELHDRLEWILEVFNDSDLELLNTNSQSNKSTRSLTFSDSQVQAVTVIKSVDTFVPASDYIISLVRA